MDKPKRTNNEISTSLLVGKNITIKQKNDNKSRPVSGVVIKRVDMSKGTPIRIKKVSNNK
jgi:hypothetical protein